MPHDTGTAGGVRARPAPKAQAARRPAPGRRAGTRGRARRPLAWWAAAAAVAVAAGGAIWWVAARPQAPAAPLLGERVPDEGYEHVPVGTQIQYRAHPPASGPHYPSPAPTGVYPGLAPGFWVHSLEHGYIVLVYRPPVSPSVSAQFHEMVRDFPKSKFGNVKFVVAPYDQMVHPFAVLAWDWRMWMDTFDRGKVLEFYRQHVDHGREDIP